MTYTTYYSSSDAHIYFSNSDSTSIIKIDTTIAVAYNVNQTSTPIYDLGSRVPRFFSTGNTVCNGLLMIAFTDEEYIKKCIEYVTSGSTPNSLSKMTGTSKQGYGLLGFEKTPSELSNEEFKSQSLKQFTITGDDTVTSIGAINDIFDIRIYLNNEQLTSASDTKLINLRSCKLVTDKMEIDSTSDNFLTRGWSFLFKDIERK